MTTQILSFTAGDGAKPVSLRQVALLGYAEESRALAEDVSPDTEIWGINAAHYFLRRKAHYWFQLHPRGWATSGGPATGYFGRPKEHFDWLQKFEGTLWLGEPDPDFPENLAHANVYNPKAPSKRKTMAQKLVQKCKVVCEPAFSA